MCWERVTHSSATYTAVDDYDFMKFAHSASQAALRPNIYHPRFTPRLSILYSLPVYPPTQKKKPLCFFPFLVLANHTEEGFCCWILIFIYTASLWCPPSPPSPQCSVSTSLSPALPALPTQNISHPALWVRVCVCMCVLTVVTQENPAMLEYETALWEQPKKQGVKWTKGWR